MQPANHRAPLSVRVCNFVVGAVANIVPAIQRKEWEREWKAEIWHRWQFLLHMGLWNRREASRLLRSSCGAIPDAIWHVAAQETVQATVRGCARSPWTCLGGLAAMLVLVAFFSSGFAATRQLVTVRASENDLFFIWLHPGIGGADRGVPADVVPAWALHSQLLKKVAPFNISKARLRTSAKTVGSPLVISTEPSLFGVLETGPAMGSIPSATALVLDDQTWKLHFHSDPKVVGKQVSVGQAWYSVAAVLPPSFHFLTRGPSAFLVEPHMPDKQVMALARARAGVGTQRIDKELTKIAQDFCYYFLKSQLRLASPRAVSWTPVGFFLLATLVAAGLSFMMCRVRWQHVRAALQPAQRKDTFRRAGFFGAKLCLGLAVVFTAGIEATRSQSAILFAAKDPANGPVLVWLYILGTMGIFFWAVADQRLRCHVCLRLMCFPVRIGCPGCLLLNWSGTELLCTEGHGVLHVPHLASSWEEAEQWISLDESWRSLFAGKD